jgi:hypothetical protein
MERERGTKRERKTSAIEGRRGRDKMEEGEGERERKEEKEEDLLQQTWYQRFGRRRRRFLRM